MSPSPTQKGHLSLCEMYPDENTMLTKASIVIGPSTDTQRWRHCLCFPNRRLLNIVYDKFKGIPFGAMQQFIQGCQLIVL